MPPQVTNIKSDAVTPVLLDAVTPILFDNYTIDLREPMWTPLLLNFTAIVHFFLSIILIISYCYLKVCKE